jgi:hypothetical protein
MTAYIHPVALIPYGPGDAADLMAALQKDGLDSGAAKELERGGKSCGPAPMMTACCMKILLGVAKLIRSVYSIDFEQRYRSDFRAGNNLRIFPPLTKTILQTFRCGLKIDK